MEKCEKLYGGRMIRTVLILLMAVMVLAAVPVKASAKMPSSVSGKTLKKTVKKIVNAQTKGIDAADKEAKLKKIYTYAVNKYAFRSMTDKPFIQAATKSKLSAANYRLASYTMLKKRKGSCFHEAAALSSLIRRATGYKTRYVIGKTNVFSGKKQPHAWTEVRINGSWYLFDSNAERTKGDGTTFYMVLKDAANATYAHYESVWSRSAIG